MATGTRSGFWDKRALPAVLKHALLKAYVPPFAGMTGSESAGHRVVFLDGYAGEGRFRTGEPASAELILQIAKAQKEKVGLQWSCVFVEAKAKSAATLKAVVEEYRAQGVDAMPHHGDVLSVLDDVVLKATGLPLFVFLDPCGLGLPFERMVSMLTGARQSVKPATEFLLNFSLEAVRRIGGHVTSVKGNETTLTHFDKTVGGTWWRAFFSAGVTDDAVEQVVAGFLDRLGSRTGMSLVPVPVRRAPGHKPVYYLIFGTRSPYGLWVFGDAVARSTQTWWETLDMVEAEQDPDTLFTPSTLIRPVLEAVEADAVPVIVEHLTALLKAHPAGFKVVDYPTAVFGQFYGQARELTVRRAVKALHKAGGTSSTGVGGRVRDLVVLPPTR